jgi:hypothetical protein
MNDAVAQAQDSICVGRHVVVVRHEQNRRAAHGPHLIEQLEYARPGRRVE